MQYIYDTYNLNEDKVAKLPYRKPDIQTGWKIDEFSNPQSQEFVGWYMTGDHNVDNYIKNVSSILMKKRRELKESVQSIFTQGYHPDIYTSPDLEQENISYHQEIICALR